MRRKIQVPHGFPTTAEIVRDLGVTKKEVEAVRALLDQPIVTVRRTKTGRVTKSKKSIRQMIAGSRPMDSNHIG